MNILVDSSVWIDYFKSGKNTTKLDSLVEQNLICINDLILAELVPFLRIKKQLHVIKTLNQITRISLDINWNKIIDYQTTCISNGINNVGIPDLIILDNIIQNKLILYTLDNHFKLINRNIKFDIL